MHVGRPCTPFLLPLVSVTSLTLSVVVKRPHCPLQGSVHLMKPGGRRSTLWPGSRSPAARQSSGTRPASCSFPHRIPTASCPPLCLLCGCPWRERRAGGSQGCSSEGPCTDFLDGSRQNYFCDTGLVKSLDSDPCNCVGNQDGRKGLAVIEHIVADDLQFGREDNCFKAGASGEQ